MIPFETFRQGALRRAKNALAQREAVLPPEPMDRAELIYLSENKPVLPKDPRERIGVIRNILTKVRTRNETIARDEMFQFINGIVSEQVSRKDTVQWLRAVHRNGLTPRETVDLTLAMAASGKILDLSEFGDAPIADKHSTGGIGDKTSLVVGPLVAACDVKVGKMSGKGLGITGGTIDKLEALGVETKLSAEEFTSQLRETGLVIAGQSSDLAPADGILYSLRNETGTIDSIPLIAASIMSKKIASGANTLVLDVKYGKGAFMKTPEEAEILARTMVDIGKAIGINCVAELSDMNQPLGFAVGNALEVREAIDTLKGNGPQDFQDHCIRTAAEILVLAGRTQNYDDAVELVRAQLGERGKALYKFGEMIAAQGGNPDLLLHPEELPQAKFEQNILASRDGYIDDIDAAIIGKTSMQLGAKRPSKDEPVEDLAAGVLLSSKVGKFVNKGDVLCTLYTNDKRRIRRAERALKGAISVSRRRPLPPKSEERVIR